MKKILVIIFFFTKANAVSISDYEIENFISEIFVKIIDNKDKSFKIHFNILLDENPNAFINEKNIVFITTGLIKYVEYPETLIGILAHEMGHLDNFHISKRKKSLENLRIFDQIGNITAIASSVVTKNPEVLLKTAVTNKMSIHNYYSSYSRNQEREADIYAINILNKLEISSQYLIDFLIYLEEESYKKGMTKENFQFATHPNYDQRLKIISNFALKIEKKNDIDLYKKYQFIRAKLFGYTEKNSESFNYYLKEQYEDYSNSILLSKQGKLLESLKILNNIIKENPTNFNLIETKADILFNQGYTREAKNFYELALYNYPKNKYVRKRLFEIDYQNIDFENFDDLNNIFNQNKNLIFYLYNDNYFLKKWEKIFSILGKQDWLEFLDANNEIINQNNESAIEKLNNIVSTSGDKVLLKESKKLINKIKYE